MDERIVGMKVNLARIDAFPKVVAEMVKPAEKIESIRVHHISGLGAGQGAGASGGASRSPVNQALDSILEMAVQLPALRKIGEQLGVSLDEGLAAAGGASTSDTGVDADKTGRSRKP